MVKHLTTKNIFKKIEVHPFFYVVSFFTLITGNFKSFTLFMGVLLVHELGHILTAYYFKWNIQKIKIYPFGALTVLKDSLNRPIKEEFWITIMGPIFQCIFYFFINKYVNIKSMHYSLLFFNLLPIIPLDGSKLVSLLYQRFFSYWSSFYWNIYISMLLLPFLFFQFDLSLVFFLILMTLSIDIFKSFQNKNFYFQKFILERTLYQFHFPRRKMIQNGNIKKMKRDTKHFFYQNHHYISEKQYLKWYRNKISL